MRFLVYAKKMKTTKCMAEPQCRGMPLQVAIKLQVSEHIFRLIVHKPVTICLLKKN
jgi:hypothetical protein